MWIRERERERRGKRTVSWSCVVGSGGGEGEVDQIQTWEGNPEGSVKEKRRGRARIRDDRLDLVVEAERDFASCMCF